MNKQELKKRKIINSLYEYLKNTPKKLKIVCGWDEVIQPLEPYAFWKTAKEADKSFDWDFKRYFGDFWELPPIVTYSSYGSKIREGGNNDTDTITTLFASRQREIKNSPNFYQESPFLTIAEQLLKLIKEDKVEKIIFLSTYDKRKFSHGDPRKKAIFAETFGKLTKQIETSEFEEPICSLKLLGFDSEKSWEQNIEEGNETKPMWIGQHVLDMDILIDDNPSICGNMACALDDFENEVTIITPYYPAVENQHHQDVLLLKTSVSALTKENFK